MRLLSRYSIFSYIISFFFLLFIHYSYTSFFFFFNDTATPEIYTFPLHAALPICGVPRRGLPDAQPVRWHPARLPRQRQHRRQLPDRLLLLSGQLPAVLALPVQSRGMPSH